MSADLSNSRLGQRIGKRIISSAVLVFLFTGLVAAQERTTVFRDLAWGDPAEALGPVTYLLDVTNGIAVYFRSNEDRYIGTIRVDSIRYAFFRDKLLGISIRVPAHEIDATKRMLKARFGQPLPDPGTLADLWFAPGTIITFEEDSEKGTAVWSMISTAGIMQYEAWLEEQAIKNAESF